MNSFAKLFGEKMAILTCLIGFHKRKSPILLEKIDLKPEKILITTLVGTHQ
jgi:hypothetical protein